MKAKLSLVICFIQYIVGAMEQNDIPNTTCYLAHQPPEIQNLIASHLLYPWQESNHEFKARLEITHQGSAAHRTVQYQNGYSLTFDDMGNLRIKNHLGEWYALQINPYESIEEHLGRVNESREQLSLFSLSRNNRYAVALLNNIDWHLQINDPLRICTIDTKTNEHVSFPLPRTLLPVRIKTNVLEEVQRLIANGYSYCQKTPPHGQHGTHTLKKPYRHLAISSCGTMIALAQDDAVYLWNTQVHTLRLICSLPYLSKETRYFVLNSTCVQSIDFNKQGTRLGICYTLQEGETDHRVDFYTIAREEPITLQTYFASMGICKDITQQKGTL